ncbi:LOW QUALITY PROTEIN: hypothetical protein Cgig2_021767 [Carnegiea gigantea]|uniref:Uncharacterized protein n=1 Tax=Carnegiea gigantea TaxID=171969 RepID=A0A9Q1GL05_9CARY|nr:LOW QUALITY PROTEIN: hypothetical protein Cgig2_021767 [Carnegiea gigantea]
MFPRLLAVEALLSFNSRRQSRAEGDRRRKMELRSSKIMNGRLSSKPEPEDEHRKRTSQRQKCVDSNDKEREELRCLIEGEMWEDSLGIEYEDEAEGDSDFDLLLESKCSSGRDEGRCRSTRGEGPSGEQCRTRDGPSTASRQGKCKVEALTESTQLHQQVAVINDSNVVLRSRCTIKKLVGLNTRIIANQRQAVKETIMCLFLRCPEIGVGRHLTLALIKCWVLQWKAFRLGEERVLCFVFDVALLTGLSVIGRKVEVDGDEVTIDVRQMVRMIEDTQKKLCVGPLSEVQLNGLCLLTQVRLR